LESYLSEFVALGVLCVFVVVCLLHLVYFVLLPRLAHLRYRERDPERLRRYLEWVVATPSLLGALPKLVARDSLAGIYLERGQHAEVVAHFRTGLESLSGLWLSTESLHSLEANFRVRLADSLEALGRLDEAAAERRRAKEEVDRAEPDALRHSTRAKLLERQNRYEEAYGEYQRALDLAPAFETLFRIECVIHLVLTAQNAGRPADCVRWAEEAAALGARGMRLCVAHRMAGVACGDLGRLKESERHIRLAYEIAAIDNDRPAMAEILAQLAECLYRQGKLVEADEAVARAAAMDRRAERMSLAVGAVILAGRGRYDDALAAMERFREGRPFTIPRDERRIRAVCSLDRARVEAQCGRTEDAWRHIHEALAELGNDAKLGLKCETVLSWVLAVRGDAGESQRLAASLEPRLAAFERDPSTCRGALYNLGMAAGARGDHAAGIDCWTRYLALNPHRVYRPDGLYHRGECHRHLGHLDDARADYEAAVAMNIDSHFSRLARRRLGELALS
jgi:tetratricopeptide (TPR) repeat protein